jgi:hypothetical protein
MTNGQDTGTADQHHAVARTRHVTVRSAASQVTEEQRIQRSQRVPAQRSHRSSPNASTGGFRRETGRVVRASYYFIVREQARRAWFIFVACVAFASLPWTAHLGELRQGAIVVAGLAAGAVFLPELNSKLWSFKANEIRDIIPEHKRRAFYTQLISADCPEDEWAQRWAILMWRRGVLPLLDAAGDSRRIRWNMTYEVSVYLHQEVKIGRRKELMARVEAFQSDERVLPATSDGLLWVSVAGNDASLLSEFNEDRCLSREIVGLPGLSKEAWFNTVRQLCSVNVRIGSRKVSFGADDIVDVTGEGDVKIVRWLIPVTREENDGTPIPCQIEIHFPTELGERNFPILLASYYCAGRTTLGFKLYHGQGPRATLHYFDEFLSEGGEGTADWRPERFDTVDRQSVTYSTPADSLLWPGSGIFFWWDSEVLDEVAHRL